MLSGEHAQKLNVKSERSTGNTSVSLSLGFTKTLLHAQSPDGNTFDC